MKPGFRHNRKHLHRQSFSQKQEFYQRQYHAQWLAKFFQKDTLSVIKKIEEEFQNNPLFEIQKYFEWKDNVSSLVGFYNLYSYENAKGIEHLYRLCWQDIFISQVRLLNFTPKQSKIALSIIQNVNNSTGLITDPNWSYSVLDECDTDENMVQSVRKVLTKDLEPVGMCSTTISEYITIQLNYRTENATNQKEIDDYLNLKKQTLFYSEFLNNFNGHEIEMLTEDIHTFFNQLKSVIRFPDISVSGEIYDKIYPSARIIARIVPEGEKVYLESYEISILPKFKINGKYNELMDNPNISESDKNWAEEQKKKDRRLNVSCS